MPAHSTLRPIPLSHRLVLPVSAELIPELQRLGQRLQQARQAQGISLSDQAEHLHMGAEQLRALEQGNREELPEAVFVVAQARRVATSLGLDIDEDIAALRGNQAFLARPGQRQQQPRPVAAAAPAQRQGGRPDPAARRAPGAGPARLPLRLLGLGVVVLAVAGLAWGLRRSLSGARLEAQMPAQLPAATPQEPTSTSPPASPSDPAARAAGAPQPPSELVLRSAEPSWLEVRAAGGELLFRGTLEGEQRFPLGGELQVLAGRPDLVTASTAASPGRPLGPIEAVTWYRFSPGGAPAPAP
jgi:cytoskeleton protein RodZ